MFYLPWRRCGVTGYVDRLVELLEGWSEEVWSGAKADEPTEDIARSAGRADVGTSLDGGAETDEEVAPPFESCHGVRPGYLQVLREDLWGERLQAGNWTSSARCSRSDSESPCLCVREWEYDGHNIA